MPCQFKLLESAVSEYGVMLTSGKCKHSKGSNADHIINELSVGHDWTKNGARTIVTLANEYGAFMLRNALALAIALEKEDGDLDF